MAKGRQRYAAALLSTLGQLLRIGTVYVVLVGLGALHGNVHRPDLVLEHFVLLVCLAGIFGFARKAHNLFLVVDMRVCEELNVLDCCEAVST